MAIRPNRKPMKFASGAKDRQQKNAIEAAISPIPEPINAPVTCIKMMYFISRPV